MPELTDEYFQGLISKKKKTDPDKEPLPKGTYKSLDIRVPKSAGQLVKELALGPTFGPMGVTALRLGEWLWDQAGRPLSGMANVVEALADPKFNEKYQGPQHTAELGKRFWDGLTGDEKNTIGRVVENVIREYMPQEWWVANGVFATAGDMADWVADPRLWAMGAVVKAVGPQVLKDVTTQFPKVGKFLTTDPVEWLTRKGINFRQTLKGGGPKFTDNEILHFLNSRIGKAKANATDKVILGDWVAAQKAKGVTDADIEIMLARADALLKDFKINQASRGTGNWYSGDAPPGGPSPVGPTGLPVPEIKPGSPPMGPGQAPVPSPIQPGPVTTPGFSYVIPKVSVPNPLVVGLAGGTPQTTIGGEVGLGNLPVGGKFGTTNPPSQAELDKLVEEKAAKMKEFYTSQDGDPALIDFLYGEAAQQNFVSGISRGETTSKTPKPEKKYHGTPFEPGEMGGEVRYPTYAGEPLEHFPNPATEYAINRESVDAELIKYYTPPNQTVVDLQSGYDWIKNNLNVDISKHWDPSVVFDRALSDPSFLALDVFSRFQLMAAIERPPRPKIYKGVVNFTTQNKKTEGSNIVNLDTVVGCGSACPRCYGLRGCEYQGIQHNIPVAAELKGKPIQGMVYRVGTVGDGASNWYHTKKQLIEAFKRSDIDGIPAQWFNDNVFFITKLQTLDGFDPNIFRNLQITLDPLYPAHMYNTMLNILRLKKWYGDGINMAVRIRSVHTKNPDLNASQDMAVKFAVNNKIPVLETPMRWRSEKDLAIGDLNPEMYTNKHQIWAPDVKSRIRKSGEYEIKPAHWAKGGQYVAKSPPLWGKVPKELYNVCDYPLYGKLMRGQMQIKIHGCKACGKCEQLMTKNRGMVVAPMEVVDPADIPGMSKGATTLLGESAKATVAAARVMYKVGSSALGAIYHGVYAPIHDFIWAFGAVKRHWGLNDKETWRKFMDTSWEKHNNLEESIFRLDQLVRQNYPSQHDRIMTTFGYEAGGEYEGKVYAKLQNTDYYDAIKMVNQELEALKLEAGLIEEPFQNRMIREIEGQIDTLKKRPNRQGVKGRIEALRQQIAQLKDMRYLPQDRLAYRAAEAKMAELKGKERQDFVERWTRMSQEYRKRANVGLLEAAYRAKLLDEFDVDSMRLTIENLTETMNRLVYQRLYKYLEAKEYIQDYSIPKRNDGWYTTNELKISVPELEGKIIHPVIGEALRELAKMRHRGRGYKIRQLFGAVKLSQFVKPTILGVYDIVQHYFRGMWQHDPIKGSRNLAKGIVTAVMKNKWYFAMNKNGAFSPPGDLPRSAAEEFIRIYLRRISPHTNKLVKIVEGVSDTCFAKGQVDPYDVLLFTIRSLSHFAWTFDKAIRAWSIFNLMDRGVPFKEACFRAARGHGAYSEVSPRFRETMGFGFFTPTFKFLMGRELLEQVLREPLTMAWNKAKGKEVPFWQFEKWLKGMVAMVAIPVAAEWYMRSKGFVPESDNWWEYGWKWKKTVIGDDGKPYEVVIAVNNVVNLPVKLASRAMKYDPTSPVHPAFQGLWNVVRWELHPIWRTAMDIYENKQSLSDGLHVYDPITHWKDPKKDPVGSTLQLGRAIGQISFYAFSQSFRHIGNVARAVFKGALGPDASGEEQKVIRKALSGVEAWLMSRGSPLGFAYAYARVPKKQVGRWKLKHAQKALYTEWYRADKIGDLLEKNAYRRGLKSAYQEIVADIKTEYGITSDISMGDILGGESIDVPEYESLLPDDYNPYVVIDGKIQDEADTPELDDQYFENLSRKRKGLMSNVRR